MEFSTWKFILVVSSFFSPVAVTLKGYPRVRTEKKFNDGLEKRQDDWYRQIKTCQGFHYFGAKPPAPLSPLDPNTIGLLGSSPLLIEQDNVNIPKPFIPGAVPYLGHICLGNDKKIMPKFDKQTNTTHLNIVPASEISEEEPVVYFRWGLCSSMISPKSGNYVIRAYITTDGGDDGCVFLSLQNTTLSWLRDDTCSDPCNGSFSSDVLLDLQAYNFNFDLYALYTWFGAFVLCSDPCCDYRVNLVTIDGTDHQLLPLVLSATGPT